MASRYRSTTGCGWTALRLNSHQARVACVFVFRLLHLTGSVQWACGQLTVFCVGRQHQSPHVFLRREAESESLAAPIPRGAGKSKPLPANSNLRRVCRMARAGLTTLAACRSKPRWGGPARRCATWIGERFPRDRGGDLDHYLQGFQTPARKTYECAADQRSSGNDPPSRNNDHMGWSLREPDGTETVLAMEERGKKGGAGKSR